MAKAVSIKIAKMRYIKKAFVLIIEFDTTLQSKGNAESFAHYL